MAIGIVELIGSQIGSSGSNGGSGNTIAKAIDADFTTFYDAANASNDWVGIDAGAAVTVVGYKFSPRVGDSGQASEFQFEQRLQGGKIQASSSSTFASDVTDIDTIPSTPAYHARRWNERTIGSPISRRYVRYLGPANARCNIAELRFLVNAGPSSAKPVQPVISPWGGRYPAGLTTVTITSRTTSASIYYTTDGSTPTNASTLYTAPFSFSFTSGKTLKAIAYDASLGTPTSDVSTAIFKDHGYVPREDWHDDNGVLIELHGGSILRGACGVPLQVDGHYWWFGMNANGFSNIPGVDFNGITGVWLQKSTDLYNWVDVGNVVANPVSGSYCERPWVIFNTLSGNYVMWIHIRTASTNKAAVLTASHPAGPWTLVTSTLVPVNGFKDCSLYLDDDGQAYVLYNGGSDQGIYIARLNTDFQSSIDATAALIGPGTFESPIMVKHEGKYLFLYGKQNYYDSSLTYQHLAKLATSPLGTYTTAQILETVDPVGTDYNAQTTCALLFPNGLLMMEDRWEKADIYTSRYVWLPVDDEIIEITPWDLSRFNIPTNTFLDGLAAFFPLNEIGGGNAIESVAANNAILSGTVGFGGLRPVARSYGSGYHHAAYNAAFDVSTGDFFVNVWIKRQTATDFQTVFSKDDLSSNRDFGLYIDSPNFGGTGCLTFYASSNGTTLTQVAATTFGIPPLNTWVMVTCWVSGGKAGIAVNGVFDHDTNFVSPVHNGSSAGFTISQVNSGGGITFSGLVKQLGLWKRVKPTIQELVDLYSSGTGLPYSAFQPANGFAASPSTIPANHAGTIRVNILGTGTNFGPDTIWNLGTGLTKIGQGFIDTTHAYVDVATGATTGPIAITESVTGTATANVTVATATISTTPTSGRADQTPRTITVVGTNTVFTQENVDTLFSLDAGMIDEGSVVVIDDTHATFDLSGGGYQVITITHTPTGGDTTDTYGIAAANAYTWFGPSRGRPDVESGNFSIDPNGDVDGIEFTPTSPDGVFTPTSVVGVGNTVPHFTYTPSGSVGDVHTLSITNNGGIPNADNRTYTLSVASAEMVMLQWTDPDETLFVGGPENVNLIAAKGESLEP